MIDFYVFLTIIVIIAVLILIYIGIIDYKEKKEIKEKLDKLATDSISLSPEEFFKVRGYRVGKGNSMMLSNVYAVTGVYILYNKTKNMHYVGQGKNVMTRVNSHLTGSGNGNVYADFKYGDEFLIKLISLAGSGYYNINDLEKSFISLYESNITGYNRTIGNRS